MGIDALSRHFRGKGPHHQERSPKADRLRFAPLHTMALSAGLVLGMSPLMAQMAAAAPAMPVGVRAVPVSGTISAPASAPAAQELPSSLREAMQTRQFTILGDTDHSRSDQVSFLGSAETFRDMQAAGIKHIFLEMPREAQFVVDGLYQGTRTRAEFVTGMSQNVGLFHVPADQAASVWEGYATVIERASQANIQVHFADDSGRIAPVEGQFAKMKDAFEAIFVKYLKQHPGMEEQFKEMPLEQKIGTLQKFTQEHADEIRQECQVKPECKAVIDGGLDDGLKQRLQMDGELARYIRGLAGAEPSVVFFGAYHGGNGSPLQQALGAAQTIKLDIYPNMNTWIAESSKMPDASIAILADSGRVVPHTPGDTANVFFYRVGDALSAPKRQALTPAAAQP